MSKPAAPRRRAFYGLAALVFLVMLAFNCATPYIADDYTFAYSFTTGLRLHSLPQLLQSLATHYYEWSGRVIVKFFAQGFTMLPKLVFNICNAAAYLGLGLVIYRLARGRRSGRYDVAAFALIEIVLWEISPAFGQTNLWMCGACNYLWSTLLCLAFLLPWRYYLQKPFAGGRLLPLGMAAAGVLAGWALENTSAGLLVCLVLCLALLLVRRQRPPLWMWTGLAGTVLGFILLVSARGNYNRASTYVADTRPLLTRLAVQFFNCLTMLKDYAMPLLFAFAVLAVLLATQTKNGGRKALVWPGILLLGGLAANFAMMASPAYDTRVTHGPFAFLCAACIACLVQLDGQTIRRGIACAAACGGVLCAFHLLEGGYDIASYAMMNRVRDTAIRAEIAETGAQEIKSYAIAPYTRWCAGYGLPDIKPAPAVGEEADSIVLCRNRWYGVESLTAAETRTYPFPGWDGAERAE